MQPAHLIAVADHLLLPATGGPLNARCKLVAARQRAAASVVLDLAGLAAEGPSADQLRWGEGTRARCAAAICARYALFWRREDLNDASESPDRTGLRV